MLRQSTELQPSLFEDETPCVVLPAGLMGDLAALGEALLREIATTMSHGEIGDEQDQD